MEIREIPLADLVIDQNLNLRDKLDDFTVERYADAWTRMPPVTVFDIEERWLLADGFHRHAAAAMLGKETIRAEIRQGVYADAMDFVSSVNLFHGLPLSRAERRRAVEIQLKLHHDWSDRRLSEELSIGRELIAKIRKAMVEGGLLPALASRVGADGKTYTTAGIPRDPNERKPGGPPTSHQEDPRDRGGRESDAAPWDDTTDPMPSVSRSSSTSAALPPWEDDVRTDRSNPTFASVESAAPSIDEMLGLMANQLMEVIAWSEADGFAQAYKSASGESRKLFQTAALKLASRADQLHQG